MKPRPLKYYAPGARLLILRNDIAYHSLSRDVPFIVVTLLTKIDADGDSRIGFRLDETSLLTVVTSRSMLMPYRHLDSKVSSYAYISSDIPAIPALNRKS